MNDNKLFIISILLVIALLCPVIESMADVKTEEEKLAELDRALAKLDRAFYDTQKVQQGVLTKVEEVAELQEKPKSPSLVAKVAEPVVEKPAKKAAIEKKPEKEPAKKPAVEKPAAEEPAKKEPEIAEYIIGEGDVLYVYVWGEEDLNSEVMVRPDGRISYPLAGEIYAAGLTLSELSKKITERLGEYLRYPVVSVSVRSMAGQKVIILGEVGYTGVFYVSGNETILEVIAEAGGFNSDAVVSSVILIRDAFENPVGMRLNLSHAIDKLDMSQNVRLKAGDIVYVPKKFIANVNYFINQIIGPLSGTKTIVDDLRALRHPGGK